MSGRFKLQSEAYANRVQVFRRSFNDADIVANVERTSRCPELIVNEYVDRANQLAKLILEYKKLLQKDCAELNSIVNDLMRQEEEWARTISEKANAYNSGGGGYSSAGGGGDSFGRGTGGGGVR